MGINGFHKMFGQVAKSRDLGKMKSKSIIVDAHGVLYQKIIGIMQYGYYDIKTIHIQVCVQVALQYLTAGLNPIFVFDGNTPKEKEKTIKKRQVKKEKKQNANICTTAIVFKLTKNTIIECINLLNALGIITVLSKQEADSQCAILSNFYKIPVVSSDTDLAILCHHTILELSFKTNTITEIYRKDIIELLNENAKAIRDKNNLIEKEFTEENLLYFVTMMGTDYNLGSIMFVNEKNSSKHTLLFELFVICDMDITKMIDHMIFINNMQYIFFINIELLYVYIYILLTINGYS